MKKIKYEKIKKYNILNLFFIKEVSLRQDFQNPVRKGGSSRAEALVKFIRPLLQDNHHIHHHWD